jgi:hypothetical protein
MAQFFGIEEIIKPLTKTSATIVEWEAGSKLRIGGQGYNITSTLTLDITTDIDTGAVASDTTYYIYAVVVAGTVSLKYSLSNLAPLGYVAHKRIGILKTDDISELLLAQLEGALDQLVFTEENVFSAAIRGFRPSSNNFQLDWESSSFIESIASEGAGKCRIVFKQGIFTEPPTITTAVDGSTARTFDGPRSADYVISTNFANDRTVRFDLKFANISLDGFSSYSFMITCQRTRSDYRPPKTIREILGL